MKTKLTQLVSFVNKIDRHYIQIACFVFTVVGYVVLRVPSDGSIGPI